MHQLDFTAKIVAGIESNISTVFNDCGDFRRELYLMYKYEAGHKDPIWSNINTAFNAFSAFRREFYLMHRYMYFCIS